jgi:hypothetical protein
MDLKPRRNDALKGPARGFQTDEVCSVGHAAKSTPGEFPAALLAHAASDLDWNNSLPIKPDSRGASERLYLRCLHS